jgi:catechol 2,3-dioxygenase-like lactoylglutathione lyase family enzyme
MNRRILQQAMLLLCLYAASAQTLRAQATYSQGRVDIGLVVSDLERSIAFYQDALGMQRVYSFEVGAPFAREAGLTAGVPLNVVAMKLTADDDAPVLKLVRTGEPETYRPRFIDDQSGVRYLTVFVTALAPVLERLKHHDVPVLGEGPVRMSNGQSLALVQDPDGLFVELIGPMNASSAP